MMDPSVVEKLRSQKELNNWINGLKANLAEVNKHWPVTRDRIVKDIQDDLPHCNVYIVGSRFTGLAYKNNDCDIYIDYNGQSYHSELSQEEQADTLKLVGEKLSKFNGYILPTATVPLLCVTHSTTDINCEISCKNGHSMESSILIRQLLSSDFRVSWLVITVKWWMSANNLLGKNKFTSYTTTWLVLFFLMFKQPNILRCIMDMQERCNVKLIGRWDCAFNRNFKPSNQSWNPNCESRNKLLVQFFKFYWEDVDFNRFVLCPFAAHLVPREHFEQLYLPPMYQSYITFKRQNRDKSLAIDKPVCLQDPFDLSLNIAKDVNSKDLKKFQRFCEQSYNICQNQWREL